LAFSAFSAIFGFFCHPDLTAETGGRYCGNYALQDMRQAALWIKENIAAFGGDPDNLTIAGQSGGAAACGAILASPLMKGLFKHISIISGAIYWGFMQPPARAAMEQRGVAFMEKVGCRSIADLRQRDAWELYDQVGNDLMAFNFCIDGYFLPEGVQDLMERGQFNDVDVMIGNTTQEFPIKGGKGLPLAEYEQYFDRVFADNADQMRAWYPASTPAEAEKQASTIASDIMLMGAIRVGQLCAKYGRKAFVYLENKESENEEGRRLGSAHCAEMPYLFGNVGKGGRSPFHDYTWVAADFAYQQTVQGYWSNFARSGDPNGAGLAAWPSYRNDFDVLALGNDCHVTDQARFKPVYDYYLARLMKDVRGSSRSMMMRLPGPAPVDE
jgi:para-nitrobenzyl esterase